MKKLLLATVCLPLACIAGPVQAASFIGDSIKAGWRLPTETTPFVFSLSPSPTFTVGYGVEGEAQLSSIGFLIDFGVNSLTFTFLSSANFAAYAFNGIYFQQLGDGDFGAVQSVSGIAPARLHNMGSAFSVNFAGQHYVIGDKVVIDFVPDVPEPASWAMMIAGMGLAGAVMRRRNARLRIA